MLKIARVKYILQSGKIKCNSHGKTLPLSWDPVTERGAIEQRETVALVEDSENQEGDAGPGRTLQDLKTDIRGIFKY